MSRRHINFYKKRLMENRKLIQYALNIMSPGLICLGRFPGDKDWTREFVKIFDNVHPHVFLVEFHKITNNSFMSLQNTVA